MTGFDSKRMAAMEIEIAELKNSLAQAKQKKALRDEFAMAALPQVQDRYPNMPAEGKAQQAYWIADAMMKERTK